MDDELKQILHSISRSLSEISDAIAKHNAKAKLPLKVGWIVYGQIGNTDGAIGLVKEAEYYGARFTFYDYVIGMFTNNDVFVPWDKLGSVEVATDEDDKDLCIANWMLRSGVISEARYAKILQHIEDVAAGVPVELRT